MAYISLIELIGSHKGLVYSFHFIRYIYWRFRLLYLILLILLIKYLSLLCTSTSGEEFYICLNRAFNIGIEGQKTDI
jgi:hypothetical protein